MTIVHLRVDDVGRDDWPTAAVLSALAARALPVMALVVPAWLTAGVVRFLAGLPWLTIVQHGLAHTNHAQSGERKYEFGASRSFDEQCRDLRAGRSILEGWFGTSLPRHFAPPHDRLNPSTLEALEAEGYSLCLGSSRTFTGLHVPASLSTLTFAIDTGQRTETGRIARPWQEVCAEIVAADCAGVVLHPAEFGSFAAFVEVLDGLTDLRERGISFGDHSGRERA